jgi:hypothetical protein
MRGRRPGRQTSSAAILVRRWVSAEVLAVAPAVALFLGMVLYRILLTPTWVGDDGDDGAYFLMSRNVWRHGLPVLNQTGVQHWSSMWSPALSILLAPAALLPLGAAVVVERVLVMLAGVAAIVLAYVWLRRDCSLERRWAAGACLCLGAGFVFVFVGSVIFSDAPAAAALLAGIILLRRRHLKSGVALLALAAALRPVNVAALAAAVVWIVLTERRRRVYVAAAAGAAAAAAVGAAALALGGFSGYLAQLRDRASSGNRTFHSIVLAGKEIFTGGATLPGPGALHRLFVVLLAVAVLGLWQRRMALEALVICATFAALLFYSAPGFSTGRYLLPVLPLLVGAATAVLQSRGRTVGAAAAALAALVLVGDVIRFHQVTPSRARATAVVQQRRTVYRWVARNVDPKAKLVSFLDIQTFLYSHHTATDSAAGARPRWYFIDFPAKPAAYLRHAILPAFRTVRVFHDGDLSVFRLVARRPHR